MADWGIKLDRLRCHDAQEARDEPFIRVNGREVWRGAQVRTGDTRELYFRALLDRSETVQIELWEGDRRRNDKIGDTLTVGYRDVRAWEESPSSPHHAFRGDRGMVGDATYELFYSLYYA
jgi:hypothetical protein